MRLAGCCVAAAAAAAVAVVENTLSPPSLLLPFPQIPTIFKSNLSVRLIHKHNFQLSALLDLIIVSVVDVF